ncbi:Trehalose utilization [Allorhodopirellula solitaria]|uniref:Trehalose utilization n=2 Tax=Allorhodopirellula solitaria TaxID=2527987 RepID=A0A5C5XRV4_9BACT|nr:Trehalose utilization [Allorhodopirellula solitaria]
MAIAIALAGFLTAGSLRADEPAEDPSLQILLVTSGCCHDYDFQAKAMQLAAEKEGLKAVWTVVAQGGKGTRAEIDLYDSPDWAEGFDLVVHNECFAGTKNAEYIRRITSVHHAGVPAVVIHCAMHTYRDADIDDWREFLGVTSRRHEHQAHYGVAVQTPDHPIMQEFPEPYSTPMDELYVIEKVWPHTEVLATSKSQVNGKSHPVIWTNQYGKARVFGTTYGHSKETFQDDEYLALLVRGMQWASQK